MSFSDFICIFAAAAVSSFVPRQCSNQFWHCSRLGIGCHVISEPRLLLHHQDRWNVWPDKILGRSALPLATSKSFLLLKNLKMHVNRHVAELRTNNYRILLMETDVLFWGLSSQAWITIVLVVGMFITLMKTRIPADVVFRLRCGSPWIAHQAC